MREVKAIIPLGNGVQSKMAMRAVHGRLSTGFSIMSGLQQGAKDPTAEQNLKDIISDIAAAFGYNVEITKAGD